MVDIKHSILIVEDDVDVAEMLDAYFRVQGYDVTTVNWGEDAIITCRQHRPDLVILDIRLPDIDGFEVAKQLRDARRTADVPIIFLTEKRGRLDVLQGLELGAEDYITKPFDIQELRLRVKNALNRSKQGAINNPITNLPEGPLIDEVLTECLDKDNWVLIVVALKNFEFFRDIYGFVASDDVLRAVSLMVLNAVRDIGSVSDFVGQLNPSAFIISTKPNIYNLLKERIETNLEPSLAYFYPLEDRTLGNKQIDRRLTLSMTVIKPSNGPFQNLETLKGKLLG